MTVMTGLRRAFPVLGIALLAAFLILPVSATRELEPVAVFNVKDAGVGVEWSPDGTRLAATSGNNITILSASDGHILADMVGHTARVGGIGWSPDGKQVVSCGWPFLDWSTKVWNTNNGSVAWSRMGGGYCVAWSPNGTYIADAGGDFAQKIEIWNAESRILEQGFTIYNGATKAIAWSPDSQRLACLSGSIRIYSVLNGTYLDCNTTGWNYDITSIAWSPDGSTLVAGVNDTEGPFNIRFFSSESGKVTGASSFNGSRTNCVAWSPDGRSVAAGQEDGTVHVLTDREFSNMTDQTLVGHNGPVTSLDWSPDSAYLASASSDGTIRIWGLPGSTPTPRKMYMAVEARPFPLVRGGRVNFTVRLTDSASAPVEGVAVNFSSNLGGSFSPVNYSSGIYTASFSTPRVKTNTTLLINITAGKAGYETSIESIAVAVLPPRVVTLDATGGAAWDNNERTAAVVTGAAIIVLAGIIAVSETGRYGGMLFIIPLFTRMKKTAVLDNFTRGQLQGYIIANPGVHMNAIRDRFDLSNGEVAYHLRVLQREGFISSTNDGLKRRFYPGERVDLSDRQQELTVAQNLLLSFMEKCPGITGTELARLAGTSPQVVNYHLKKLWRMDVISMDREGRVVRCSVRPEKLSQFKRRAVPEDAVTPQNSPIS